jgi:glycosyltransferase involved in cell wall biosynthesis
VSRLRVAIVADLLEERWPSMDLVADMLYQQLRDARHAATVHVEMLRPSMADRGRGLGRYVNRYWDYPRWLRGRATDFDIFHIVDHSYAHLVHVLPAHRTVVTCHDADAFMPLVNPNVVPTRLPNVLTRAVLSGLRKAASVTCDSAATLDEVRQFDFVPADRLSVVPVGVHPQLSATPATAADAAIDAMLGARAPGVLDVLHVGSCIPRKRIDLLLRILAAVRADDPRVRLLKAGGTLNGEQRELARSLGVETHIVQLPFLPTDMLAALYRRAALALVTSEREGFGLPVIEALACGTSVVATDIPVLREVGGAGCLYAPLGDIATWRSHVLALLRDSADPAARTRQRDAGLRQAAQFRWEHFAEAVLGIYARVHSSARLKDAA